VLLHGRAVLVVADFLDANLPELLGKATKPEPLGKAVAGIAERFPAQVQRLHVQILGWAVRMESDFTYKATVGEMLSTRANLLVQGLLLAHQVGGAVRLLLALHMHAEVPLRQSVLPAVLEAVRILKGIQQTYFRKSALIAAQIFHVHRYLQDRVLQVMSPVAEDLQNQLATARAGGWRQDRTKEDMAALSMMMTDVLRGPNTSLRRAAASTAWELLPKKQLRDADVDEVRLQLRKLELLADLDSAVAEVCDGSFLLFSRGLLPFWLRSVTVRWQEPEKLRLLLAALADTRPILAAADRALLPADRQNQSQNVEDTMVSGMVSFVESTLEEVLVAPLCRLVENDLRLHIHSELMSHVPQPNPITAPQPDLLSFLIMKPLNVLGRALDLKARVSAYLDETFYNLTTIATHDWKTYAEMRSLAENKYGLRLTDSYLPAGTLEQGIDVLEIMRNIHVFVARFHYQMNLQFFVERPTRGSRYVNTIGITQVHGKSSTPDSLCASRRGPGQRAAQLTAPRG